ncbi:MAG: IucA/IucC family protein [Mesorhizobium sp.]
MWNAPFRTNLDPPGCRSELARDRASACLASARARSHGERIGDTSAGRCGAYRKDFLSCQATKRYLDAADRTAPIPVGFIAAEQSLYFRHPLHPTPKSLQGMADWQQAAYAPELRGGFQLIYFAATAHLVRGDSARDAVASIVGSLLGNDASKVVASYDDPLHAQALMLDPMASGQIRHLGPAGPAFTATSSVRTVYRDEVAWMPKFSLPVRITNSKRLNRRHGLEARHHEAQPDRLRCRGSACLRKV